MKTYVILRKSCGEKILLVAERHLEAWDRVHPSWRRAFTVYEEDDWDPHGSIEDLMRPKPKARRSRGRK